MLTSSLSSLVKPDQQIKKALSNQAAVNNEFVSNQPESHGEPPLLFPSLIVFAQPPPLFTAIILGVLSALGLTRDKGRVDTQYHISYKSNNVEHHFGLDWTYHGSQF